MSVSGHSTRSTRRAALAQASRISAEARAVSNVLTAQGWPVARILAEYDRLVSSVRSVDMQPLTHQRTVEMFVPEQVAFSTSPEDQLAFAMLSRGVAEVLVSERLQFWGPVACFLLGAPGLVLGRTLEDENVIAGLRSLTCISAPVYIFLILCVCRAPLLRQAVRDAQVCFCTAARIGSGILKAALWVDMGKTETANELVSVVRVFAVEIPSCLILACCDSTYGAVRTVQRLIEVVVVLQHIPWHLEVTSTYLAPGERDALTVMDGNVRRVSGWGLVLALDAAIAFAIAQQFFVSCAERFKGRGVLSGAVRRHAVELSLGDVARSDEPLSASHGHGSARRTSAAGGAATRQSNGTASVMSAPSEFSAPGKLDEAVHPLRQAHPLLLALAVHARLCGSIQGARTVLDEHTSLATRATIDFEVAMQPLTIVVPSRDVIGLGMRALGTARSADIHAAHRLIDRLSLGLALTAWLAFALELDAVLNHARDPSAENAALAAALCGIALLSVAKWHLATLREVYVDRHSIIFLGSILAWLGVLVVTCVPNTAITAVQLLAGFVIQMSQDCSYRSGLGMLWCRASCAVLLLAIVSAHPFLQTERLCKGDVVLFGFYPAVELGRATQTVIIVNLLQQIGTAWYWDGRSNWMTTVARYSTASRPGGAQSVRRIKVVPVASSPVPDAVP